MTETDGRTGRCWDVNKDVFFSIWRENQNGAKWENGMVMQRARA